MPGATAPAWTAALDRLEHDLVALEAMAPGTPVPDLEPWTAPPGLGPLPRELADRARSLLARQRAVLAEITTVRTGNRQQARVAASVQAATGTPDRPAYLDVRA